MSIRFFALVPSVLSCVAASVTASAVHAQFLSPYATSVVSYSPGTGGGFVAANALGAAPSGGGLSLGSTNVASLGVGGSVDARVRSHDRERPGHRLRRVRERVRVRGPVVQRGRLRRGVDGRDELRAPAEPLHGPVERTAELHGAVRHVLRA